MKVRDFSENIRMSQKNTVAILNEDVNDSAKWRDHHKIRIRIQNIWSRRFYKLQMLKKHECSNKREVRSKNVNTWKKVTENAEEQRNNDGYCNKRI
ncbi:hypothetical protein P5V15_014825 [Pogonomyrmex californicus]